MGGCTAPWVAANLISVLKSTDLNGLERDPITVALQDRRFEFFCSALIAVFFSAQPAHLHILFSFPAKVTNFKPSVSRPDKKVSPSMPKTKA